MFWLSSLLILWQDKVPADDDVVAGPWGALVIGLLILATALLLRSFTRQLKKVDSNLPSAKAERAARESGSATS